MGSVKGISSTEFPDASPDEGSCEFKNFPFGRHMASIVRLDASAPNDKIYRVTSGLCPGAYGYGEAIFISQRILDSYADDATVKNLHNTSKGKYCHEGERVRICFNYDTASECEGVCVFDRGPSTVFQILSGPHSGKLISAHECMYSPAPKTQVKSKPLTVTRHISPKRARKLRKRGDSVWWDIEKSSYAWEMVNVGRELKPWQRSILTQIARTKSKAVVIHVRDHSLEEPVELVPIDAAFVALGREEGLKRLAEAEQNGTLYDFVSKIAPGYTSQGKTKPDEVFKFLLLQALGWM